MWPVILDETMRQVEEFHKKSFDVVCIEAAVLIQAGWQSVCHEIWTFIIPRQEVSVVLITVI